METSINLILYLVGKFGYLGIFIGMIIESSFIPFPSEIVMIPAGYLSSKGEMTAYIVILVGILGSLVGATINYVLAKKIARPILVRYGRYFLISDKIIQKTENFFKEHGEISTLVGRLLPGIRQLISIPAGAFGVPFLKFLVLTAIGSGIWISILVAFGFLLGQNQDLIKEYTIYIKLGGILLGILLVLVYIWWKNGGKKA